MLRGSFRYTLTGSGASRGIKLTANLPAISNAAGTPNQQSLTGTTGISKTRGSNKNNWDRYGRDILDGFIDTSSNAYVRPIQYDIYFSDPICGSVIDIKSNFPFSNFELSGCESKERRLKCTTSLNAMQIRSMLPKIAKERNVEGNHVSYMNFDDSRKVFTSIIPYNPETVKLTPVPIYGRDPLVDITYPPDIISAVNSDDEDMKNELEGYAEDLIEMIKEKRTRLNPKFTLFVARQPFSWSPFGISILRRVIPVWLLEKALMRGTIDMAGRRQKALRQIIMGDGEWLPTNEQIKQMVDLVVNADNDPLGAVIGTRPGVEIQEVTGTDFWKVDDSWETFTTMKLRALGVSDQIFGDFSVQAAENTINSTLEDLNNERDEITQRVLYNKMFLIIAEENDYKKKEKGTKELTASQINNLSMVEQYRYYNSRVSRQSEFVMLGAGEDYIDPSEYDLPQVRYEKSLKIVSNDAMFNNLGTLAERGMPAPLRMQIAILGLPAEDMFAGLDQDIEDRKIIAKYQEKLPKPPAAEGEDDGGGDNSMFMESSDNLRKLLGSDFTARRKPNRDFDEIEQRDTGTGKVLSRRGKQYKHDRENKVIMEAAARIRDYTRPEAHDRLKNYSYKKAKGRK